MSSTLRGFFKFLGFIIIIGLIVLSIYLTKVLTGNKETVKDMSYDVEKSQLVYLDTPYNKIPTTEIRITNNNGQSGTSEFKTQIKSIRLESLNTKTDEIIKGQDYYLYYTVSFTPLNNSFELTNASDIGNISSKDWKYTPYITKNKLKTDYETVVGKNKTIELEYYIKTNEPVENLGFYSSKKIDANPYKQYHPLKKGYKDGMYDEEK